MMELRGWNAEEAKRVMEEYEREGMTTKELYGRMQNWLGERMLVDKTPSYALEIEVMKRAEEEFEEAKYIHLVRRPEGMVKSYEEARLDQIFPRFEHPFRGREAGELVWIISEENIREFLKGVDKRRQVEVKFEELVREPEREMRRISEFLGIGYEEGMIKPYEGQERRMTDGIYKESEMLGDKKFHRHGRIEEEAGERWRKGGNVEVSEISRKLSEELGYRRVEKEGREAEERKRGLSRIRRVEEGEETEQEIIKVRSLSGQELDSLLDSVLAGDRK
jgi:hypothetical protein